MAGNRRKVTKILFYDLEATCRDDQKWNRQNAEIIEIGIVPVDVDTMTVRKDLAYRSFVIPEKTDISDYCTNLTGITSEIIKKHAKPLKVVCEEIVKKYGRIHASAGYGDWDNLILRKQCKDMGVDFPFIDTYYNIKHNVSLLLGIKKQFGLAENCARHGIKFEGKQHEALVDAIATAELYSKVIKDLRGSTEGRNV